MSESVSLEVQTRPFWEGQEYVVKTRSGPISVLVCGDQRKPALLTYPDVALNCMSCFQGLFFCEEASSLLFHNFCVYHMDAPGHEVGAAAISSDQPELTVDDLADQVADILDHFGLQEVMGMGVTAGAYILTLFALKYPERVQGLILVSPLCRAPCWTEWLCNMFLVNLLRYYGMCNVAKESFQRRCFSQNLRALSEEESDIVQAHSRLLEERQSRNVVRLLRAINKRKDLTTRLRKLKCRTLIFVGEHSPFHHEALHFNNVMDRQYNALVEVQACGSLVTEEQPHSMVVPIEYFLMAYGFYKPLPLSSPLSPPCISPELLSPESLGLKLKPIKTRVVVEE